MKRIRFLFMALVLTCIFTSSTLSAQAQTVEEITIEILTVFDEISEAESSGADVSQLVEEFNQIIELVNGGTEGELDEANLRLNQLSQAARDTTETGVRKTQNEFVTTIIVGVATVIASILAWIYTPRIFWMLWLRVKGDWIVDK